MRNAVWMPLVIAAGCGINKDVHQQTLDKLAACESQLKEQQDANAKLETDLRSAEGERGSLAEKLGATQKEIEELRRARELAEKRSKTFRDLVAKLRSMIDSGQLKVEIRKGKMLVKLSDKILFDTGKADLKREGQAALAEVAVALKGIPDRDFLIAGHTDNVPIKTRKVKSNWDLSTARAVTVVKFFQEQGVSAGHLGAAGFSEFDPVGDNATEEGKAQNRRIEIVVMPNIEELPPITE
jgi:chemotaxis protein MotB